LGFWKTMLMRMRISIGLVFGSTMSMGTMRPSSVRECMMMLPW
jgi:hypothetical protein